MHQKIVLSKTKAAATPQVAASEISKDRHLVTARNMLVRLGLLALGDNKAIVTQQGEEVMKAQNLIDETGSLTPEGQKHASGDEKPQAQQQNPMESLLQTINKSITQ